MNELLNELLANASLQNQPQNVPQPQTLGAIKQAQVAQVSASKIANLGGVTVPTAAEMYAPLASGSKGVASASPMEMDVRTATPSQLTQKYGFNKASEIIANSMKAQGDIHRNQLSDRNFSETAADLTSGVALGAANSIGGIVAMGLGAVNQDAGQWAATQLDNMNQFGHDTQSAALQQHRKLLEAKDQMDKRDSDLQYQQDKAAGKGVTADLARFGRGFMSGVSNAITDPTTLSDGIAEGSGSFLALAPVSRAATAAKMLKAAAAKDTALAAGKTIEEAAAVAKGVMAKEGVAIPAAIGAMEAGGAYQGSVSEVSNMTHEQLLAGSPAYAEMIAAGISPTEARTTVANRSGLMAAAITAPFAVAAGHMVKGFEGNPLKMGAGKIAAMNMGKETIEEGSQGITGAIAQNIGIQQFADSNKSLSENVGEQGGRGALYGLGTASVMAAPSVLVGSIKDAAGSVIGGVTNYLTERGDAVNATNEAASPASINRTVEKSAALVQAGPALKAEVEQALVPATEDTPEVAAAKATALADFPGFIDALNIQETELQSPLLQSVATIIAGAKTRPEAITAVLTDMKQEKDPRTYFEKAVALQTLIDTSLAATDKLGGIDDSLLPPSVGKLFQSVAAIGDALMQSPEVMRHLAKATQLLQSPAGVKLMNELQQTPESAQVIATVAQTNPDQIVPAVGRTVLKMAQDGKLVLTDAQKTSLQSAVDLMETAQAFDAELKAQGVPKLRDIVTFEIKTEDDPKLDKQGTRSALQHARGIATLAMRGDMKGAKAALQALGNFAQGQSNKVTGINQHYAAGPNAPRVTVQVASFKGGMTDIKTPVGISPTKEGSINHAKRVTAEARFLANMHNKLNETYNLGLPALPIVELDAALSSGRTADVVAEFNNGKRGYPQQQTLIPAAVPPVTTVVTPAAPVVKAKKERKPKAVKEPKPLKISKAVKASKTAKLQERLNTEKRPAILEQIKAELALRENTSTPEIPSVTQTPEAIQAKPSQTPQETGTNATVTPAVTPNVTPAKVDAVVDPIDTSPAPVQKDAANVQVTPAAPVITPTIVPNAPSLMGQALAAASVVTPPPAPKTVAEAYPELLGNTRGVTSLDKAFNLRKIASRFLGSVSPAALVQSVLGSTDALVDFLGKDTTKRSLTPEIATYYADRVPAMVGELVKRMNASMNAALDIVPKSGTSLRMLLDKGEPVHDYLRGKALNIVESDGKGSYVYNQELVEAAVLGSLNWFQNATNMGVIREQKDVAALLGISEEDVSPAMLAAFNSGDQLTMWDVIPRMAANITEFWGMKANNDFSQSATVGIPQAVATEVLTAMIEVGLVEYNKIKPEGATQDLNVFKLDHEQLGTGYEAYPTFLAEMANSEIIEPMYFGDVVVPLAKTQMNNADVALTSDQVKAIEHEQKTPFFLNQPMLDLYKQLGLDSLLNIFGAGVLNEADKKLFNKTHLETVEGKNLSILSAFESLLGRAEEMQNIADARGVPLNKLSARFAYGMSRVGRMQMLGKQNPQASKLVREALMPNAATIDLSNADDYNGYMLAVAQMLGIKVHTKPIEDSVTEAKALLDGKLKPLVDLMLKFHETGSLDKDAADLLKELMPFAKGTFMGLHAIVDYARTQANGFDGTDYTTNVYVEADGVTNGPVNAMVNLFAGRFNLNWLRNIAKGGLFLTPNQTTNQHRKTDGVDLYEQATKQFDRVRLALKERLDKDGVGAQMTTLMKLMGTFIKDITVSEDGDVTITRGVAKNPLTITIYGSGERGIANKVTGELLDAIYAKMSEAIQKQANYEKDSTGAELTFAQAMFGLTHTNPDAALTEFRNALVQLSTRIVIYSTKKDKHFNVPHSIDPWDAAVRNMTAPIRMGDPQLFKVSGAQLAALQENMLTLFVKPLRQGIEQTVGDEVMATAKMLQIATQVQSIGLQAAFKQAVADALVKFQRPNTLFLSKNEQTVIMQELIKKFPTVKTKAQEFLVASTSQSQVKASDFSRALNNGLEMKASVFAPADSGVAGSPFLNIGMGDGLMMQTMSLMKDAIQGTLKIFDGVNIPVDKIKEGSLQANAAVSETWQGNPMRAVADSFKAALGNIEEAMKSATEDEIKAVERIFVSLELPSLDMKDGLEYILSEVEHMANQVEARHLTMQAVAHSIDQMASAEAPFQNQGEDLSTLTPEAQVIRLNEIYFIKLAEVQARYKANVSVSAELKGRNSELMPRIAYTFEGMLTEIRKLPADLQETAKQALRSPAMRDYLIIVASPENINAETGGLLGSANGITDLENKRIYIASTNPEVWVHELVHAATMEKVQGVLNGTNKDKVTIDAVARLQALRDQFNVMSSADQTEWTTEQVRAYREALNSMATAKMEYGEAAELNELMAWATTNSALIELGKTTPATFRAFEKFTRAIVNTIRRIFFGSSPDKLPRDFFNAVRFNTTLIATRKQPSATEEGQGLILRHTNSYGNDARLNQIQSTYLSLMAPLFTGLKNQAKKMNAAVYSTNLTLAVESAFPMNQQEKSTFQTVVTALATEAVINPASVAKAQELYNHVTKQLEVEDFMNNPELQDPVDRFYAQEKYDVIMGKTGLVKDALGRSSLMPVFLALATTDDGFRSILSKMNMPEVVKNTGSTLDVYLRNYGTEAMEALSDRLSGVKSTDTVTQAIDNLQSNVVANNAEKTSILGMVSNKFGGWVDTANDYAVEKLGATATAGVALGDKMKKSNFKVVSGAAGIVKVLSGSLSDKTSAFMAEGLLSAMNSRNGLQPLRDFANDMLGRVASNANIYDMIKQVRSTVAAVRQEFRENVPTKLAKTFKVAPTDEVWTELTRAMGKTDMAALDMSFADIVELVRNKAQTAREIKTREDAIRTETGALAPKYLIKSQQLANFMKTGIVGNNLYRNAHTIAFKVRGVFAASSPTLVKNIDELVTLYALRDMEQNERDAFNSLVQDEGLEFTFMYLKQQRIDETAKALQHKGSMLNHYKGYIPSVQSSGMSLIVADDTQDARLKSMSYVRVGDYNGAGAEGTVVKRGYYFNNAPTRGTFNQGIMQNVNITANGVGAVHGFTQGLTAGVITDPIYVAKLFKRINAGAEKGTNEHLMPIFDDLGGVIAYERSVDPVQLERLQSNNKLHQMLGVWRGRQIEEAMANEINNKLVDNMVQMYEKDKKVNRGSEYVNIFDPKDKILVDALKLMPADVREYMLAATGNTDEFWVRRDMVFDAFGYRTASVGDAWTGNSRFSDETQKVFQKVALGVMGNQAFSRLLTAEKFVQGFMSDARTTIVVKSVIVPALNLISNLGQLVARGVPVKDVLRKSPAKTAEIESYVKNRLRQVDAEAELRAAKTTNEKLKLEAEIQSLKDAQRRLTIWPLIEAGEFTAISDVGITHDDIDLSQGRWHQFIEKKVDKLPEAVRNAGRYAYITKDTALFQGLQKAVQYGDFLAKAIMYDDMVLRQKKTPAEAMARITEEFVNYDRLPGRFRGYLEQIGMLWFYNFKLRSSKVAISMMRNNPIHALMSNFMPVPEVFGPVGSPLEDNFLAKAVSDTLGYSIGPGMGFRAPTMNPWWQMVN